MNKIIRIILIMLILILVGVGTFFTSKIFDKASTEALNAMEKPSGSYLQYFIVLAIVIILLLILVLAVGFGVRKP